MERPLPGRNHRFRLLKLGGKMAWIDHVFPYFYDLQRYALDIEIPIWVERTCDGSLTQGILHVGYRYVPHDPERVQSRFYCDDHRVWRDDMEVTCFCFTYTCQWSDYSPYGADDFGTMLCYRAHKEEYRKVNTKAGFFEHLEPLPCEQRLETCLCPDFSPRTQCAGYRGFLKG